MARPPQVKENRRPNCLPGWEWIGLQSSGSQGKNVIRPIQFCFHQAFSGATGCFGGAESKLRSFDEKYDNGATRLEISFLGDRCADGRAVALRGAG
jgi:hypothetical protein